MLGLQLSTSARSVNTFWFFFLFPNRFNTLPSETSRGKTTVLLFLNNNSSVLIRVSSLSILAQICVMVKSHQRIKYK